MTLGSLFDGIGGWLLAARHAGVTPVWASEIDARRQDRSVRQSSLGIRSATGIFRFKSEV